MFAFDTAFAKSAKIKDSRRFQRLKHIYIATSVTLHVHVRHGADGSTRFLSTLAAEIYHVTLLQSHMSKYIHNNPALPGVSYIQWYASLMDATTGEATAVSWSR
jgi:hypothetical protein